MWIIWCVFVKRVRNSTFRDQVSRAPASLPLSTDSLVVKHGRDAARPVFSAPPTLCFHKSRLGGVSSRMGRCSCTHCHAPCTRVRSSSFSTSASSSSFRVLPSPVSSFSRRLACIRSSLSAFLCGFAVFFRLIFFFLPFRPTASPRTIPIPRARLYF